MKAIIKNQSEVGHVIRVYVTESGQRRLEVRFAYSTVDADIRMFEVL